MREHYQSIARQTGTVPPALADALACPEPLAYVWDMFVRMSERRQFAEGKPLPISNVEMMAWLQMHGVQITPAEAEMIDALEKAHSRYQMNKQLNKAKANGHR